ncbi:Cyanovirin-N [Aspergillus insuetus]
MHRSSALLALTSAALVAAQGYSTECSDVTLNGAWLIATCPTGNGDEIASSVYLPSKIGNSNGNLEWSTGGAYHQSCQDCALSDAATLSCSCRTASLPTYQDTSINLETYIENYEGHLLSNQTGPITTIPEDSTVPVPSDFDVLVKLGGLNNTCTSLGATLGFYLLTDCFYLNLGGDVTWPTATSENNNGWEISAFEDRECAGEPEVVFTQENQGECFNPDPAVRAFSWKPLWNADY